MIVTIDGPAGTGKSTAARRFAQAIGFFYFDSGAFYRAITWLTLEKGLKPQNIPEIGQVLKEFSFSIGGTKQNPRYLIGSLDVTEKLREPRVTATVSQIAQLPVVRQALKPMQQNLAKKGQVVLDGRDLGTVVFPQAELKFFLIASEKVRAERRFLELSRKFPEQKGDFSYESVMKQLRMRDQIDAQRELAPLKKPDNSIEIDTSYLTIDEVIHCMLSYYRKVKNQEQKKLGRGNFLYRSVIFLVRMGFKLFYRYRVFGLEHYPVGGALIAANHTSFYDPPALAISCPEEVHFLARSTLFRSFFGKLIGKLNAHPLTEGTQSLQMIKMICRLLSEGKKVMIFPEGTRSKDGQLGPLQRGIATLFFMSKAAIVPAYISGAYTVWSRKRRFPKLFGQIDVVFGSPLTQADYAGKDRKSGQKLVCRDLETKLGDLKKWHAKGCYGTPP